MKQTSFETRQRAAELLKEAVAIWKQSNNAEVLEGLETDPVFNMLTIALAHQSNELDADVSLLLENLWDSFADEMLPYGIGRPLPATVVVSTMPVPSAGEAIIDNFQQFTLHAEKDFNFIPLFNSRVLGIAESTVSRIDGRRWLLKLDLSGDINSFDGFSFAIKDCNFGDLHVTHHGRELTLINSWDLADIPYTEPFSIDTMLFNFSPMYNACNQSMDLFARNNIRLFIVNDKMAVASNEHSVDLTFEFEGVGDSFVFDTSKICLNVNILVNAEVSNTVISSQEPVYRLPKDKYLLHLMHASDEQIFGNNRVRVLKTGGDRFNTASLMNLLHCLSNKFNSDYYAFSKINGQELDDIMTNLASLTRRLGKTINEKADDYVTGTYLAYLPASNGREDQIRIPVNYLTTDAMAVNPYLGGQLQFVVPSSFDSSATVAICKPVLASDEVTDVFGKRIIARYYMSTNDRIVTPADIKLFCRTELKVRYGIVEDMIKKLTVRTLVSEERAARYYIAVEILLAENRFIRKSFVDKLPMVETLLSKMMMVRSANIYPIEVRIRISDK